MTKNLENWHCHTNDFLPAELVPEKLHCKHQQPALHISQVQVGLPLGLHIFASTAATVFQSSRVAAKYESFHNVVHPEDSTTTTPADVNTSKPGQECDISSSAELIKFH